MMAVLRFFFFFFEGDLPRVSKQELREQSRVRRERSVGDHWNVSGIIMIFSRRDLRSSTFARNGIRIFSRRCAFMTESFENVFGSHDPQHGDSSLI